MDAVFAYGSLINANSHRRNSKMLLPVKVKGIRRGWFLPVPDDRDTGLGIVFEQNFSCNGVLIPCEENEIFITDLRETMHGYCRVRIPKKDVFGSGLTKMHFDNIWAYVTQNFSHPTKECPIAQSYLDVVIAGCLSIGWQFAREFVETTYGWEFPWVNDRLAPRYRRAIECPEEKIDILLREFIPEHLIKRTMDNITN